MIFHNSFLKIFMKEQDSFENYKGELEKELGITDLKPPTKPMNAYMRYFLERSSEERAKGQSNFSELSSTIADEWNHLADNKRDYYQQIFQIRSRERDALLVQYDLLSNQRRVLSPYSRFIKKRYLQYSKEYKNLSSLQITKLANQDWKKLSTKEKDRLRQQFEIQKNDLSLNLDRSDQINEYLENLEHYHNLLEQDKNKILRKYGLNAEHKAQVKLNSKERRIETNRMLKDIRLQFKKEARKKYRESIREKINKEKERILKINNDQKQSQKLAFKAQRQKIRAKAETQKKEKQAKKLEEKEGKQIASKADEIVEKPVKSLKSNLNDQKNNKTKQIKKGKPSQSKSKNQGKAKNNSKKPNKVTHKKK